MAAGVFELGYFEATDLLGKGSMGSVWRGRHLVQGIPVAIKVLNRNMAGNARAVQGFESEVRAVSRLSHKGIIQLFDFGWVDEAVEAACEGEVVSGCPYQIMELASGGSLDEVRPGNWTALQSTLMDLLDALAHAHAHGLIHRDLKPENVVICAENDARPGLKLTDWGIARALEDRAEGGRLEHVSGTPQFMAPEQFTGMWRDAGPWTDLYALGCLAYHLASGRAPFVARNYERLANAHLYNEVPGLTPRFACPPEFEAWVGCLLRKEPGARFQRAADAASALADLAGSYEVDVMVAAPTDADEPAAPTRIDLNPRDLLAPLAAEEGAAPPSAAMAPHWRREETPRAVPFLMGSGLGLFGIRSVPLVGREADRDVLWEALAQVHRTSTPRLVVVQGPRGVGKARLARWTAARADELGAALTLTVTHSATGSPSDGVLAAIARHFRCGGLSVEEARERVRSLLQGLGVADALELSAMVDLLCPESVRAVRVQRAAERYGLIARMLERIGAHRPVIAVLQDLQWGWDSVRLVRHMMTDAVPGCRVLLVGTLDTSAFDGYASNFSRPCPEVEVELLGALRSGSGKMLVLGPLGDEAQRALVEGQLGLTTDLADEVIRVANGNPRFALRLVAGWVQRGDLIATAHGYELLPSALHALPAEVDQLWDSEVARLLEPFGLPERDALQIAVLMGESLTHDEWAAVETVTGANTQSLLRRLHAADLAQLHELGWSFRHKGMVDHLLEGLDASTHRPERHRQVASALEHVYAPQAEHAERLGWHLHLAGDSERGVEVLLEAVSFRLDRAEDELAARWVDTCLEALRLQGVSPESVLAVRVTLSQARLLIYRGKLARAAVLLDGAIERTQAEGWYATLGQALIFRGQVHMRSHELAESKDAFVRAKTAFDAIGDARGTLAAVLGTADVLWRMGQVDTASRVYAQGLALATRLGDGGQMSIALIGIGDVHTTRGEATEALAAYDTALRYSEENGLQARAANIYNSIGELEKDRGNLAEAEASYRRALEIYAAIHSPDVFLPEINLALVTLRRQDFATTRQLLHKAEASISPRILGGMSAVHSALAACAVHRGEYDVYDARIARAVTALAGHGGVQLDDAWPLAMAGELMMAHDPGRALTALTEAQALWERLGRSEEVARIAALIAQAQ